MQAILRTLQFLCAITGVLSQSNNKMYTTIQKQTVALSNVFIVKSYLTILSAILISTEATCWNLSSPFSNKVVIIKLLMYNDFCQCYELVTVPTKIRPGKTTSTTKYVLFSKKSVQNLNSLFQMQLIPRITKLSAKR